jgi:cytochrome bd-type quinol oxidase subunit 2
MIKSMKRVLLSVMALSAIAAPALLLPVTVAAQAPDITQGLTCGVNLDLTNQTCDQTTTTSDFQTLLNTVINIFSLVVGVIAVIMIIVGGLRYITSGGDSGKVSAAKTTIIYALVGLVIVALAQLIVHFVLSQASSVVSGGA